MDSTRSVSAASASPRQPSRVYEIAGIASSTKPVEIASCFLGDTYLFLRKKKKERGKKRALNLDEERRHVTSGAEVEEAKR